MRSSNPKSKSTKPPPTVNKAPHPMPEPEHRDGDADGDLSQEEYTAMDTSILAVKPFLPGGMKKKAEKAIHCQLGHVGSAIFKNGEICKICASIQGNRHQHTTTNAHKTNEKNMNTIQEAKQAIRNREPQTHSYRGKQ